MTDPILRSFLEHELEEATRFAAGSDLIELFPEESDPVQRFVIRFRCQGLVRGPSGAVREADRFDVGVHFNSDYLRRASVPDVLTWLWPPTIFHPNIAFPYICVGMLRPGTSLVEIILQCHEIISYRKVTMREDDALNREACGWARANQHRFPIDTRPIRRRALALQIRRAGDGSPTP